MRYYILVSSPLYRGRIDFVNQPPDLDAAKEMLQAFVACLDKAVESSAEIANVSICDLSGEKTRGARAIHFGNMVNLELIDTEDPAYLTPAG